MVTGAGEERLVGGTRRFADEDAAARYWLKFLRDGTLTEKREARGKLAAIFERRGMLTEAIELLETNGRTGVRDADLYARLAHLYRRVNRHADADAALAAMNALDGPPAVSARRNGTSFRATGVAKRTRRHVGSTKGWTSSAIGLAAFLIGACSFAMLWLAVSLGSGNPAVAASPSQPAPTAIAVGQAASQNTPPSVAAVSQRQPGPTGVPAATNEGAAQPDAPVPELASAATAPVPPAFDEPTPLAASSAPAEPPPSSPEQAAQRRAYAAEVGPPLVAAGAAIQRMSDLSRRAADNPQLILDPTWKQGMAAVLAEIRGVGTQLQQERVTPSSATDVGGSPAGLGKDLVYIADEMQAGIDGPNMRRLQNALTRTTDVNARLPVVQQRVEALGAP